MAASENPRVMIDARPSMGGVERYTFELARLVRNGHCRDRIILYGREASAGYRPASPRRNERRLLRRALGNGKRILTDQLMLPLAACRSRAELIHSPNYLVPLCTRKPVVVTCHDLSLLDHFPTKQAGLMRYYERALLRYGLQRAAHIIAPSRAVAAGLSRRFHLAADRVSVLYPPLPSFCFETESGKSLPDRHHEQAPFFLSVGTIEPRKNLHRLLQGWRRAYFRCRIPLLLVGPYGWGERKLLDGQLAVSDGLRWLGCVDDSALADLYRQATAVIQYSLEEGFDYPVAEALCAGTPVVLSDIGVHREVTADCGLFAPPAEPDVLADRLLEVCSWSVEQRADFRQRSRQQADLLRQSSTIEPYLALYEQVLAGR
jgi:glycosyltransferase involved in cell wall biosynthesis